MHNLNLRQTLKNVKLCQFLLVKWVQIRAEMTHKQVMNVYVIKEEDKKKKKPLGKICIVVFFFFLSKEPNLSPADLWWIRAEEKHISECESQKTLLPWACISISKNKEAMNNNMLTVFSQRGLLFRKAPRILNVNRF